MIETPDSRQVETLPKNVADLLVCPECKADLLFHGQALTCKAPQCSATYRFCDGIPVLTNEARSPVAFDTTTPAHAGKSTKRFVLRHLPKIDLNVVPKATKQRLVDDILALSPNPVVLNIGGKHPTSITAGICKLENVTAIECDFALRPRTGVFANPAQIPLADETVDAVMLDGLLEHVSDPQAVVREAWRVLKPDGIVYSDAPFILQVHGGAFDYARFSQQAHRCLFQNFEELDCGVSSGPGVALAYAIQYFLLSFSSGRASRNALRVFSHLTLFWIKYFDLFLARRPGAHDAAHGFYYMGRKSDRTLTERDLLTRYNGLSPHLFRPAGIVPG